jgi:hypothetical protein
LPLKPVLVDLLERFKMVLNALVPGHSEQDYTHNEQILSGLRNLLRRLYPTPGIGYIQRQQIAERYIKAVYITSHMDDENFDMERLANCCVSVPYEDGRMIPTCAYNNIYRQRDKRFYPGNNYGKKILRREGR